MLRSKEARRHWLGHVVWRAKRKVQGQEMEGDTTIGNFKEVDGILFATQIENHIKGRDGAQTFTIDKIEVNPTIDTAMFAMPEVKKAEEAPAKKNN